MNILPKIEIRGLKQDTFPSNGSELLMAYRAASEEQGVNN